jgi:hypothetical protein
MPTTLQRRLARSTGTHVIVEDVRDQPYDDLGWATVCEEHGGLCTHPTRALALAWAPHPDEWCPTCQETAR